jgi:hypothetical protein
VAMPTKEKKILRSDRKMKGALFTSPRQRSIKKGVVINITFDFRKSLKHPLFKDNVVIKVNR